GDPGRGGRGHVGRDAVRVGGEAAFEVRIDRNVDRARDGSEMRQRFIERDVVIATAQRPGETRTGGRQRGEPELREKPRAPRVPRVRQDEAARLMKLAKAIR